MKNLSDFALPSVLNIPNQGLIGKRIGGTSNQLSIIEAQNLMMIVKDFFDPTSALPVNPAVNVRYISEATANGWTTNYIYTWNGTSWVEDIPQNGTFVMCFDRYVVYTYIDNKWQLSVYNYKDLGTTTGAGGTYTFNAMRYNFYRIQIAHTTNINPTGTYTSGLPYRVVFLLVNSGAATITWNSAIKWANGVIPTFTVSGTDMVVFTTVNGGTTWQGSTSGLDYK